MFLTLSQFVLDYFTLPEYLELMIKTRSLLFCQCKFVQCSLSVSHSTLKKVSIVYSERGIFWKCSNTIAEYGFCLL